MKKVKILKILGWIFLFPFMLTYWGWSKHNKPALIIGGVISILFVLSGIFGVGATSQSETSMLDDNVIVEEAQNSNELDKNKITEKTSDDIINSKEEVFKDTDDVVNDKSDEEPIKDQKNGYNEITNNKILFNGYGIQVPNYWEESQVVAGFYQAYAETEDKVAMIQLLEMFDDEDNVNFEILFEEKEDVIKNFTLGFKNVVVLGTEIFKTDEIKGVLYKYTFDFDGRNSKGSMLIFPIEKGNKWGVISYINTYNTEFDYVEDIDKIMNSIILTDKLTNVVSEPIVETKQASESKNILTADNNDDLAKLLETNDYDVMRKFASDYVGRTIQFDGNIANMAYHGNYKTRFDILIDVGNYSATSGPRFKYEDVNIVSDLKLTGSNIPESIQMGQNIRVTAKVLNFNNGQSLFFLKPVKTEFR